MTAATVCPEEVESVQNVAQSACKNACQLPGQATVESTGLDEGDDVSASHLEGQLEEVLLNDPHSRLLGGTEQSWCKAVGAGTGVTVLALLFSNPVDASSLQHAINVVQQRHPRLRSKLLWINGRPAFKVSRHPFVNVEEIDATSASRWDGAEIPRKDDCEAEVEVRTELTGLRPAEQAEEFANAGNQHSDEDGNGTDQETREDKGTGNGPRDTWLQVVEVELNTNIWPAQHHNLEALQIFVVRLYRLPGEQSIVILRLHTAACDRVGAAVLLVEILRILEEEKSAGRRKERNLEPRSCTDEYSEAENSISLPSVEDAIPKGQANKPFWAHGVDLLGYSLGSRRHASLEFEVASKPRRSELIVSTLSKQETQQLLEACVREKSCLYGALSAAGLKAAASVKQTGNRGEHYAVVSLVDCRRFIQESVSDPTVGFYHSALMNTHHVTETTQFWELARRGTNCLGNAMKNRKYFTDMGDLNFLMSQAIQHPHLTPHCSLRTSMLVLFKDDIEDDLETLRGSLGLEDYLGCSSIHGVGPSIAVFHSIRNGSLHCCNLYPAPLHSRQQMQKYVNRMMEFLVSAL